MVIEQCYRENLPNFSIWYVRPWFTFNFGHGFIKLPNKSDIEYRHKPSSKLLYLRFTQNGCQSHWQSICIVRNRTNMKLFRLECPHCCACVEQVWAVNAKRGGWRCKYCCEIPSAHRTSTNIKRFRKAIQSNNLQIVMDGLIAGGTKTLDARLAMEAEGISPKKMLVESNTRANQVIYSKHLHRHRTRHRLKARLCHGRMLYVGGKLYVR